MGDYWEIAVIDTLLLTKNYIKLHKNKRQKMKKNDAKAAVAT